VSDAISKLNQALEICADREDIDGNGNPDAWMRVATLLNESLQAMQGEAVIPEWVSTDERLPEADTPVLAIVDGYDGLLTVERRWERCDQMTEPYYKDFLYWDWVDNDGQDLEDRVRFWMRLPEPPTLLSAAKGVGS
jgi:hypothetical protein